MYKSNLDKQFPVLHVLYYFGVTFVTAVEDFKLVCLEKPVMETALAALNNLCGDKIKISKE